MPHETVEIERGGGASIGLHRGHFGDLTRHGSGLFSHAPRALKAGAFGHVDHQLHFALVVEGQELDRHRLEIKH